MVKLCMFTPSFELPKPPNIDFNKIFGQMINTKFYSEFSKSLVATIENMTTEHQWVNASLVLEVLRSSDLEQSVIEESVNSLLSTSAFDIGREIGTTIMFLEHRAKLVPKEVVDLKGLARMFKLVKSAKSRRKSESAILGCIAISAMTLESFNKRYVADYMLYNYLAHDLQKNTASAIKPGRVFDRVARSHEDTATNQIDYPKAVSEIKSIPLRSVGSENENLQRASFLAMAVTFAGTEHSAYSNSMFSRHQVAHEIDFDTASPVTMNLFAWTILSVIEVMIKDDFDFSDMKGSSQRSNAITRRWNKSNTGAHQSGFLQALDSKLL
jgi:hypothetical protein